MDDIENPIDTEDIIEDTEIEEGLIKQENNQEETQNIDELVEQRANELMEAKISGRLAREKKKYDRELAEYKELASVVMRGTDAKDLNEAIKTSRDFYGDTVRDIPIAGQEEEQRALGKWDADKITDYDEMNAEANRIYEIPIEKRTPRQQEYFNELSKKVFAEQDKRKLQAIGVETNIIDNKEFKDFRNQFNTNVST